MHARVAMFEAPEVPPDQRDQAIDAARQQVEANWAAPPEGLDRAREMWMLVDRENARGLGIVVFETEEDLRRGDEALSAMSGPAGGGQRTDVAFYEVALHKHRD